MKVKSFALFSLTIPFKESFRHSAFERDKTETVLCKLTTETELDGYGEGCPRSYVSGETVGSCVGFLKKISNHKIEVESVDQIKEFAGSINDLISINLSAWCSVELALLDIVGKHKKSSISELLGLSYKEMRIKPAGIIGICNLEKARYLINFYANYGVTDYKIKISGDVEHDVQVSKLIRDSCPRALIRFDANNYWNDLTEVRDYLSHFKKVDFMIEEPFKEKSIDLCVKLAEEFGIQVILDETFKTKTDLKFILQSNLLVPNLRISKLGGMLNTLEVMKTLAKENRKFIFGSHVGETSLLGRAQLILALAFTESILSFEGGYSCFLLSQDPCEPKLTWSKDGFLELTEHREPGLGIQCNIDCADAKLLFSN